ncbi:hypothetical protein [Burkholderia anthina]|uniref:hypothetical protein n=1 Tax=Burkholderia anthina TaxID=179879 RepID=UPI00158A12E4|nr:hypothetical protein [Burkholderia anthina]
MTFEEFERLWDSGQRDKLWSLGHAIDALEQMAAFPNGNKFTRAAARRELLALRALFESPVQG